MSPSLHNRWFAHAGINAVYLPLLVGREPGVFEGFLDGCLARPWLHAAGFSVTIPHKEAAARWVRHTRHLMKPDDGTINTIFLPEVMKAITPEAPGNWRPVCDEGDLLRRFENADEPEGMSTDAMAAMNALLLELGRVGCDMRGLTVDVLGTGGAARAVIAMLWRNNVPIVIYGRDFSKAQALARKFGARAFLWERRTGRSGRIVINCTSVGMWPKIDESPLPPDTFAKCELVFDLIYNPLKTKLLADAEASGVKTLNGLDMFVRQASMQFEAWTGIAPDVEIGQRTVLGQLGP